MLRCIVNQGTKQSERQHLLHSKRPRHSTYFCSHFPLIPRHFSVGRSCQSHHSSVTFKAGIIAAHCCTCACADLFSLLLGHLASGEGSYKRARDDGLIRY